ncbi:hypothetical protein [endosymbiont GvMRE of Glomus versiforme]|uniref:hypothetical protein n=1 Tax=endosymbiont GvMRE of Glomus versiforme TaxID=2039283 RepID=UPI000EC0E4CE|nr:hypothetical protein [endosymbiont GvMRE of Glomus versiforme]RHZ36278.1 hypothetical protein GvMRE_Ic1g62 [endosymbiont GvMRE of Glomus versiforme]RHZ37484.1 hypothetical protein GvMRE_I1g704 [endosymbiont GvMRE of Glomus versiforme]
MLGYIKCPKCQEINPLYTPYPKCYQCGHTQYIDKNKTEQETQSKVKEMVKYLIPTGTPLVDFPESSINPITNESNAGWSCNIISGGISTNTISIPRNTLYMSRKIIVDTTAHESAHILTWDEDIAHGPRHEKQTEKFVGKLNNRFGSWINQPNPNVKYLKNYYKKHPEYSLEESDLLFDPYED